MTLTKETGKTPAMTFRWHYIALPAAILGVSLILTAVFFPRLPAELAYHFKSDGTADRSMGRNQLLFVLLFPQAILTMVAAGTVWGMIKLGSRLQPVQIKIKAENITGLMGNILALPGIVLLFFMLDVFLYNAFQIHFLPLWLTGTAVMVISGVIIVAVLGKAFREIRRPTH